MAKLTELPGEPGNPADELTPAPDRQLQQMDHELQDSERDVGRVNN
jgi:hypothetical protein